MNGARGTGRPRRGMRRAGWVIPLFAAVLAVGTAGLVPANAAAGPARTAPQTARATVPQAGAPAQLPTEKTTVTVGGKPEGDAPPPPPADALGAPSADTLVHAHQLGITAITDPRGANQSVRDYWTDVSPATNTAPVAPAKLDQGLDDPAPRLFNPVSVTVAGRFRDPKHDRVLSLRNSGQLRLTADPVAPDEDPIPAATLDADMPYEELGYALAAGDLDRVVGADGNYHDEAVVASVNSSRGLHVQVVDYNANASHLLVTMAADFHPTVGDIRGDFNTGFTTFYGSVGVAVGNFSGDSDRNEIAVTWQDAAARFHVALLTYTAGADGQRSLTVVGDPDGTVVFQGEKATNTLVGGYAQTVAGDFEGDGRSDIAIAYAAANPGTDQLSGHLGVVSFAADGQLRGQVSKQFSIHARLQDRTRDYGTWTPHGLALQAGLFKFDASAGTQGFQRRQLAVAWTEDPSHNPNNHAVAIYDVAQGVGCSDERCGLSLNIMANPLFYADNQNPDNPIAMAVGSFDGVGTGDSPPLWSIVIYLDWPGVGPTLVVFRAPTGTSKDFPQRTLQTLGSLVDRLNTQVVLTGYDRLGKSLVLGAPLVYSMVNLTRDTSVAAQPPTEADYLNGTWVNVSRVGDFNVTVGSASTKSFTHTRTETANWSDGVTESLTIKGSIRYGPKDNSASINLGLKQKFAMNWLGSKGSFSKYSTTITQSVSHVTTDDDFVTATMQTDHIYRYPILGAPGGTDPDGKPLYPFYQVRVPGPVIDTSGTGRSLAFYQPSWENGNALSYPKLVDGAVQIPDLGPYSYTDAGGGTVQVTAPLMNIANSVGGGKTSAELKITGQTGTGNSSSAGTKLAAGVEVNAGVSFKAEGGFGGGTGSIDISVGYNAARASGIADTGAATTTSANSFKLEIPTIDSIKGYQIGTAYYIDTSGVPKVIHGVDLTLAPAAREWWIRNYGTKPDPALNLPDASYLTYDAVGQLIVPKFSTSATRQLIRGFQALQPYDPGSPMTSGQPYSTAPQNGDSVSFAVQVHNFSLMASPAVPVDFYAVPVDQNDLEVTGPPQRIGSTTSTPIGPQGVVTVKSPAWTAAAAGGNAQHWRIFVIVDPNNNNEVHPWHGDGKVCPPDSYDPDPAPGTVDPNGVMIDPMTGKPETLQCGQNNQGYGTLTVVPKIKQGFLPFLPPLIPPSSTSQVELHGAGLTFGTQPLLQTGAATVATATVGQQLTGTVHTAAPATTTTALPVLIYDGPRSDGRLIAATTVNGTDRVNGGTATFTWRPATPGLHDIYEVLVGGTTFTSTQLMQVNVLPAYQTQAANPVPTSPPPAPAPSSTAPAASIGPTPRTQPSTGNASSTQPLAWTGIPTLSLLLLAAALLIGGSAALITSRRRQ